MRTCTTITRSRCQPLHYSNYTTAACDIRISKSARNVCVLLAGKLLSDFEFDLLHHRELAEIMQRNRGFYITYIVALAVLCAECAESRLQFEADASLQQVEFATQATHLGATVIGAKSRHHAVLISYTPRTRILASPGRKIFRLSEGSLMSAAGLAFDVNQVANSAFEFASSHLHLYGSDMPCGRLATKVADMMHAQTMRTDGRPVAARMLLAGYDDTNLSSL